MVFEYRQSDCRAYTSPTPLSCHPVALCVSKSCQHSKVPSDQHMADEPRALSLSRTSCKAYQGGCTHHAHLGPAHRPHCTRKMSGSMSTGTLLEVKTPGQGEMFAYPGLPRTAWLPGVTVPCASFRFHACPALNDIIASATRSPFESWRRQSV